MKKTKVCFERNFAADCVDVYVICRDFGLDKSAIGKPLEMKDLADDEYAQPTFRVNENEVQNLMDDLWNMGFRPSEVPSEKTLAAKDEHIRDLRKVAFKLMKIDQNEGAK